MRLVSFLIGGLGWPLVREGQRLSLPAPPGTWLAYGEYFVWAPPSCVSALGGGMAGACGGLGGW